MRVLLVHNSYQMPGGENSVFKNLYRILKRVGQEVDVYSRHNLEIQDFSIQHKVFAGIESFFSLRTWREVQEIVRKRKIQVAIVQNVFPLISPSVYYALKAVEVPIIQLVYNYRIVCPDAHLFTGGQICERCVRGNYWHAVMRKCYKQSLIASGWYAGILGMHRLIRTFVRKVDRFVVPDHFMASRLVAGGIPAEKIRKNVNPFFVEDYQPSYESGNFILYIGRLIKQKGVFTLVKSALELPSNAPPIYIAGDGEERERLESLISSLGLQDRVRLLGPKWGAEVQQLMRESMFVVVPSEWYDNLPLVICQSYAMAKPVIASNINGIPEYVENEVDGLLFQPGDANELARCINRLSQDLSLRMQMSLNARRKAEKMFDFQSYWRKMDAIIQEVVS